MLIQGSAQDCVYLLLQEDTFKCMNEVVLYRHVPVHRELKPCRDNRQIRMHSAMIIACGIAHLGMFAAAKP